jgi:hypothetical protein
MKSEPEKISRRKALVGFIVLPALAGIAADKTDGGKASKAHLAYQSSPHLGQRCANCRVFHAGKTPAAPGTCDLVQGAISPNGWCRVFVARAD